MQSYFESELDKLKKRINKMFSLVVSQVELSFKVLNEVDPDTVELIKQTENRVDKLDVKIDKLCQRIFALSQPVATDLRFIMSSLKIGGDMERISDIAYDISKHSESISQVHNIQKNYKIKELLKHIEKLIHQTQEAYTNINSSLAVDIINDSRQLNEACSVIFKKVIAEMSEKSEVIYYATDLILITNNLDRMISHTRNIAESIVFIADGKIIKHVGSKNLKSKANSPHIDIN
jgi:phosphate transport system protein